MPKAIAYGKTFPVKDQLRAYGWKWDPINKVWAHTNWTVQKTWPDVTIEVEDVLAAIDKEIVSCQDQINEINMRGKPSQTAAWLRDRIIALKMDRMKEQDRLKLLADKTANT